jgi:ankyrin repeat protein
MTATSVTTDLLAFNFNLETTDFLAQFKLPPETPQNTLVGQSFLHELAREGDLLTAELVVDTGGAVDLPDDQGRRPLHEAALHGQTEIACFLMRHGARLDAPVHPFGHTALYYAAERGHAATAQALIAAGARIDVEDLLTGQGLLHLAAARGDMMLAGQLIAAGIDVFREDRKGLTARDHAARNNHPMLERALLKVMQHQAHYCV